MIKRSVCGQDDAVALDALLSLNDSAIPLAFYCLLVSFRFELIQAIRRKLDARQCLENHVGAHCCDQWFGVFQSLG